MCVPSDTLYIFWKLTFAICCAISIVLWCAVVVVLCCVVCVGLSCFKEYLAASGNAAQVYTPAQLRKKKAELEAMRAEYEQGMEMGRDEL